MESVEGKMTELTEQMLACWMSAWRITTLAPKGHRVRWLSRFHCRSLALPRGMVLSQSAGWAAVRAGRMWPKYGQRGEPQNMESWKPSSFALLDTWPHPLRIVRLVRRSLCTIQGSTTDSYYGTRRDPRSQNCSDFFWDFFCWRLEPEPQALSVTRTRTRFPCDQGEDFLFHSNEEKNHCLGHDRRQLFVFLQGHARYLAA